MKVLKITLLGLTDYGSSSSTPAMEILFWFIAILWSLFLAFNSFKIHFIKDKENKDLNYKDFSWQVILHQFVFNFGSAFFGWFVIWKLMCSDISFIGLTTPQFILLGISLISLFGYLPALITKGNPFK